MTVLYSRLARPEPDISYQMPLVSPKCQLNGLSERNAIVDDRVDHVSSVDENGSLTSKAALYPENPSPGIWPVRRGAKLSTVCEQAIGPRARSSLSA